MPPSKLYQAKLPVSRFDPGGTADRVVLTADGATMTLAQLNDSAVLNAAKVRGATRIVAASNASAAMKNIADYVCDGNADEAEINAAFAAITSTGGSVQLSEGTFTLAAPVIMTGAKQVLRGMGQGATLLQVVSGATAAVNVGMVQVVADDSAVLDMTIDGQAGPGGPNAAQSNMRCIHITHATVAINRSLVQRVRMINVAYGLVMTSTVGISNAVIRDCIAENLLNAGFYLRALAGQPTVASGLTVKGPGVYGFMCDNGPVLLSDCHVLNLGTAGGAGFYIASTPISLAQCTAQGNAGPGFNITGSRAQLVGCQAIGNANYGFYLNGPQPTVVNCIATGTTGSDPNGYGFMVASSATDPLIQGCDSLDNATGGFLHNAPTTALFQGNRASNNGVYGLAANSGPAHVQGGLYYGAGASSTHGVAFWAGSDHTIDGARIANNGLAGVYVHSGVGDVQVTGNHISGSSLTSNAGINHIRIYGARVFVHKNLLRDPASGNRPWGGVVMESGSSDGMIGINDTYGAGVGTWGPYGQPSEVYDAGTNTRRVAKLLLDYTAGVDLYAAGLTAQVWQDVPAASGNWPPPFTVLNAGSLIVISCQGSMLCGAVGIVNSVIQARLLVDGVTGYQLGGEVIESASYYQNALTASQPVAILGLAAGSHTVRLQVRPFSAMTGYLRASGFASQEFLQIQVWEFYQ